MDLIDLEILEDGTVSVKTGAISDINHLSADDLLTQLDDLLGGRVNRRPNEERQRHQFHHHAAKTGGGV